MGNISFFAIRTIIKHRLVEYFKEYNYTIISPLVGNLLFIIIFVTIDHYYSIKIEEKNFIEFIIPGLILIVVAQESFDNASNTLINMKQIGSFNDYLSAPISRIEILFAFLLSSILIGIFLALLNFLVFSYFVNFETINIIYFIYYLTISIVFFSSLGCIIGFVSYYWDTQSSVSNFFVIPISFLSGTFFSINTLHESLQFILYYNPYYYVVSNFRSSFYYNFEYEIGNNLLILFFLLIMLLSAYYIFYKGFKVIK